MARKCWICDGTGIYKKPLNEEVFDREFDRFDNMGQFDHEQCREKALKESGYTEIVCPHCNGTGIDPEN